MEVNKRFGPYALQLYLYLAKNKDNYLLALSPAAAALEAGIKRTTFEKYVGLLTEAGYLVKRKGNTYDFYETPYGEEYKDDEEALPYDESASPWDNQNCSRDDLNCSPADIEIYNTYTNNAQIETNTAEQEEKSAENADATGITKEEFIF